jgi:prepilin-type N-terminal cleavage/methylation domain-containing protein
MKRTLSSGFTLVELLVVITIIGILAGLVLGVAGNIQKKAAESRARVEIAAIETALERYRIDNGDFPDAQAASFASGDSKYSAGNPSNYQTAGRTLFTGLAGRTTFSQTSTNTQYIAFKESQIGDPTGSSYIVDPYGYAYGYVYDADGDPRSLFNRVEPDIWSTAGQTSVSQDYQFARWITNWGQ